VNTIRTGIFGGVTLVTGTIWALSVGFGQESHWVWAGASWLLALGLLKFGGDGWVRLSHRYTSYRVGDEGIEIRRGVIWRTVVSIPGSRVQHTDVSRGPLQRRFEVAALIIHTAGTTGAIVELSGLEYRAALEIRDLLISRKTEEVGAPVPEEVTPAGDMGWADTDPDDPA